MTEADGVTNIVFDGYISEVEVYASYRGPGRALLSSFKDVTHVAIAKDLGGLAVTGGGVEVGVERMVSPSSPCTFTVTRADDAERLCKGFNASSSSGVVYYDFAEHPDGVEFTVDGLTTSVDIAPVYAANQRYYVDAVNGSDTENHGCFSNSAYRTIMRACTNAYITAGDEICLFPGVYDEGAVYHAAGAKTLNRVLLPYGVNLTGLGATPADVVVAGAEAPVENQVDEQYGCGLDATRCIYLKGDNVVRDLTVADGHTWVQDDLAKCDFYAGVHARDATADCYLINCTVTGCVARYQAVVGEDKLSMLRCYLHHNRAVWYAVVFNAKCYNCYIGSNYGAYPVMNSPEMVNCTVAQTGEAFTFRNDSCKLYNSVTLGNQQRLGYYYRSYMKGYGDARWPVAEGHLLDGSVTNVFTEAWVGGKVDPSQTPATPSRRSDLFDAGNNAYLDLFPARFPEEKLIDFLGNPRIQGASVDVGAIEKQCPGAMMLIQ